MRPRSVPLCALLASLALVPAPAVSDAPPATVESNCAGTSTGMIPIDDLGAAFYQGAQGGLYAGGSNHRPVAHNSAGVDIANALTPLDTLGHPSGAGRVVIVSIGMSNCTQEFSAFVPKCASDPQKRSNVVAIDCAEGGQTASIIRNPSAAFWDTVATRLRAQRSSPLQAQVVWFKEANANPTGNFATSSAALAADIAGAIRTLKAKLPNVKLCYLTSRIYAGYATSTLNPEPYAYESGFAVKNVIEEQISGVDSLNFDANVGAVEAPWLSWGPYLWADGLTPRSDGLTWACADFNSSDGTHPSASGRDKVADSLLAFFRVDETTAPWYRTGSTAVPLAAPGVEAAVLSLRARPVPASADVALILGASGASGPVQGDWRLVIVDAAGRRVRDLGSGVFAAGTASARWNLRDDRGRRVGAGVYWARAESAGVTARARIVVR